MAVKRITKVIAEYVALELMLPKKEKYNKALSSFQSLVQKEIKKVTPKLILENQLKTPQYFQPATFDSRGEWENGEYKYNESFYTDTPGIRHKDVSLKKANNPYFSNSTIEMLIEKRDVVRALKMENKEKEEELMLAVLSFKTMTKLLADFPEAYEKVKECDRQNSPKLPVKNIDNLRKYLKL